ncbi:sensor histidine kinase [Sutcliffiella rhizosphaerae]|uniref:histidine kinase n=1 Tax=Sutcliffiella rhizosphaerae TaxID=2880967 RepID=A0ABN8ACM9_9BACI|nr:HAMP domain-containing sensor histidine kinase [Sutcliffiella rhizosphaerae]CAG9620440.1 Adaptive-response sensory-kinase SasA [Sutcliffiella rhizosphaerae]
MTIRKRLLLSNVAMIILPIIGFFLLEIFLGTIMFHIFRGQPDGERLQLFLSLRFLGIILILILANGLLTYYVARSIIQPIRELMRAAEEISKGNLEYEMPPLKRKDELQTLAQTFEQMRQKLIGAKIAEEHYAENQKLWMASISHDLKTPLTSIKGYVKGMQDGVANTPEKREKYLATIEKKAEDMNTLIEELFLFSKLELESVPFHFAPLDLKSYLEDVVDELRFYFEEENGLVTFETDHHSSYVIDADRDQLKRVITNLTANSLKFMTEKEKHLHLNLHTGHDYVELEWRDNGIGIPKESLPYIFDRFYRTDPSRNSETGGSGLGLAITKKIIHMHKWTIWAESTQSEGTSIFIRFRKKE